MISIPFFRSPGFTALFSAILLSAAPLGAATEKSFTTSSSQATEAEILVKLLEQAHYNHAAVSQSDYSEVIPDYMTALDGQHLFFLRTDKADFVQKNGGQTVYFKVAFQGDLSLSYDIFNVYDQRVEKRIGWIFDELKKDISFDGNDTYAVDRTKVEWPASPAEADDLWRRRIKYELVAEMLNKKTAVQAKEVVHKRYERLLKNIADIESSDLAELFLSSVTALYDPHSSYFSSDSYEDFGIQMKLQLVGIGAMLKLEDDYCTVEELVPGGPADLGRQLKPHDKIVSVAQDGEEPVEIIGMKLRKIVNLIRGRKGSNVHLIVQPAAAADASVRKEVVIARDVVKLNSARAHAAIFQVPSTDGTTVPMGVLTLPEFYGPADDPAAAAEKTSASQDAAVLIGQMKEAGIKGLVLDLRHNGGGFLGEAINLAGLFIPKGPVVQVRDGDGRITVDSDDDAKTSYDGPMAVLTDRFSASASEIVAGALQNYGRAIVIGDNSTHGKGTVQTVLEMKNLARELALSPAKTGAAKITIQKFYLPNGSSTQLKGVVPDISLPSVDDFLPIGESSLPHALIWDRITTTHFDGKPLDSKLLSILRQDSLTRQSNLQEFTYLRKNVDRFKSRQAEKLVSLNLEERKKQKLDDDAFKKETDTERDLLAKSDYPYKEFRLGPPPPPKIKAPKKDESAAAGSDASDDDEADFNADDNESYAKVDVHLRETFRILDDAIDLGRKGEYWASNHAPLTIVSKG